MPIADVRINARLTGEDAVRYHEALERSGLGASDLLREALREYHAAHIARPQADALQLLSGFIGAGDGPPDLASNYKHYLAEALEGKHPLSVQENGNHQQP